MPQPRMLAPPVQHHIPMDNREMVKQELARKLSRALMEREMTQSDLARAAKLPRELVSTYVRGKSFPTPVSLQKIAKALGFKSIEEFLPDTMGLQVRDEHPSLDMRQLSGHPNQVWLRVNQAVSLEVAAQIMRLLTDEAAKKE